MHEIPLFYFFMLHRPWSGTTTFHCCTEKSLLTRPTRARQVSRYLFGVVCLTCFPKCAPASLLCCEYPDADLPFVINQITREPWDCSASPSTTFSKGTPRMFEKQTGMGDASRTLQDNIVGLVVNSPPVSAQHCVYLYPRVWNEEKHFGRECARRWM